MLLLTTTGARSGKPHTTVLGYYPDTSDRILVVGSAGGGPKHPDWYHNLLANPRVTVEDGLHTYQADAVVLRDAERDEIFDRLVEADPGWGKYQADTTRILPVVALIAATTGPPPATLTLRMIHDAFRRELTLVRKEVVTAASTGTAPGLGAQLRINCLNLCQGLHFHHTRESGGLFPGLLATNPDLADTIERLDQEHAQIAVLLEELQTLLTSTSALDVLPRLDTLIEALNHHLDYEEAQLLPLLDG